MSEALAAVFPKTTLQTCIVHLIRHRLDFANWKERKPMAMALRPIYTGGRQFPTVVASWRRAWTSIIPFFAFPPDVRRLMYTIIWLALRTITANWARTSPDWRPAMNQFAILYDGRFPPAIA